MISFTVEDVMNVINAISIYLIAIGVVFVLAIVAIVICKNKEKHIKYLVRAQAGGAFVLALIAIINMICIGPMSTMISLVMGDGKLTDETVEQTLEDVQKVSEEGIILLENEDNVLPLSNTTNLNLFGWASIAPNYSGRGSGAASGQYSITTLYDGLENAGFNLNQDLCKFYTEYAAERPDVGMRHQDWSLPEPPASTYPEELIKSAKDFSDTAVVVLSRAGTEQADLPTNIGNLPAEGEYNDNGNYSDFGNEHYLQLSKSEREMVELVCDNFNKVIVVWNGPCAFEMGFVEEYEPIKSAIWCAPCGQNGFNGLGRILKGDVNPSGRTSDTFVYDLTSTPYYNNIGEFHYDNMDEYSFKKDEKYGGATVTPCFVNLVEGIYVGYRFYETAATEGLIDYDSVVQYPFGYGLSYTDFKQKIKNYSITPDGFSLDVEVKNVGSVAGKDVVEVYYNPPYNNGGIEKSSANLVAFDKTKELAPGESEIVSFTINAEDMASFDAYNNGCYVLESGDYVVSINGDSHTILDSVTYNVAEDVIYDEKKPRTSDKNAATVKLDYVESGVTYLSRADGFANFDEATAAPKSLSMSEEDKALFINTSNYDPSLYNNADDKMPLTEQNNGLSLSDLRGADYDDPRWEKLLDQMSITDMVNLSGIAGYQTGEVASVGKVSTTDVDGPQAINNSFTGVGSIAFPACVMTASTWNKDMANLYGERMGQMADEMQITGWYAPGINIHRSAFEGRSTEYFSEDGYLTGMMAAQAVNGAAEHGVYAYLKHFALNEQETNRDGMLCTWGNEQSIREIYLRSFEVAIKNSNARAIMCSHNYVGPMWSAGSPALLTDILRDEWDFKGFAITDYFLGNGYMNADQAVRAGADAMLLAFDKGDNMVQDRTSATSIIALRRACKNIMYTTVNSRVYTDENLHPGMQPWIKMLIVLDVVLCIIFALMEVLIIKSYKQKKGQLS
ncbi:beta-glucosidase [Pseudobutyrivibrio sp. ACV-2]|uniref:glycoside hydrolase family 3 N-terminal domain-containing protein n=1 Tax=Pseudobutyrivibrio sp. ACV-2 TaxID=1520801 RepID=UPI0008979067|nr:glycoside hydrolase family 3 N-terminal domain-containing protein [Pseudobutyrivibrio sp. ACV-2]SEA92759.1 beta-glucosidase [Pseudobutyrivibrio sp. ACV-2]